MPIARTWRFRSAGHDRGEQRVVPLTKTQNADVVLWPRHGHVDQAAQFLVLGSQRGLLRSRCRFDVGDGVANIEPPLVARIEDGRLLEAGQLLRLPGIDHDHAGKLEPLGGMHRHDRNGVFVAFDPPADELTFFVLRCQFGEPLKHHPGMAPGATTGVVEQFDHMGEIDDPTLAPHSLGKPARHGRVGHDVGRERRDPLALQGRMQRGDLLLDRLLGGFPEGAHVREALAEKCGRGRPSRPAEVARPLHRLEHDPDIVSHLAVHHAGSAAAHRGNAQRDELFFDLPTDGVGPHQNADLARLDRTRIRRIEPPIRHQFVDLANSSRRHRRLADVEKLDRPQADDAAAFAALCGVDMLVDNATAELGGLHGRVEPREQISVGAMVLGERPPGQARAVGGHAALGKSQIGVDVGSAESVDRLLRIAHGEERSRPAWRKYLVEKLPLQAARVLRLVHDRQLILLAKLFAERRRPVLLHLFPGTPEQVVETGRCPHPLLHTPDAVLDERDRGGQQLLLVGRAAGLVEPGPEEGIAEPLDHEFPQRFLVPQPRTLRRRGNASLAGGFDNDRVVDHLLDHAITEFLFARIGSRDAGQPQHPRADRMDRADRRGVEFGNRPLEPAGLRGPVGLVEEQFRVECVGSVAGGLLAAEQQGRRHHPSADAVFQFSRRVARVGRDKDRADPQIVVDGDRLRHDRRDGIGLPRASARLDEGAVGERVVGEEKGLGHVSRYPTAVPTYAG